MDPNPYLGFFDAILSAARGTPPDALLLVSAVAVFSLAIFIVAWRKAAQRARTLEHANADLEMDLAVVSTTLEHWRSIAESSDSIVVKSRGNVEQKSPRELLERLEMEGFDVKSAVAEIMFEQENSLVATLNCGKTNTDAHNT
jgi:hypothetical protein